MNTEIKKTITEVFIIEAENEKSFNYAKELVLRGDYAYKLSLGKIIKGDGYSIEIKRSKPKYE
tara:strand:- start:348 stop:536 length:189 start_codon:yes stop_codon:yes gene_type:complete